MEIPRKSRRAEVDHSKTSKIVGTSKDRITQEACAKVVTASSVTKIRPPVASTSKKWCMVAAFAKDAIDGGITEKSDTKIEKNKINHDRRKSTKSYQFNSLAKIMLE